MRSLRIATRQSPLALWQAQHVSGLLQQAIPGLEVSFVQRKTAGDRFLDSSLAGVGGKGLFVKELEQAVIDGSADLAVHSLKDMTSAMPDELCLAAVPRREDPRDAWVSPGGLALMELPKGASVGTSSVRRACQLLERRPDLKIVGLRGNVETRLRKAAELKLAGTVLALAGLRRLGLQSQVTEILEPEVSLPAVGQGALAIECRSTDGGLRRQLALLEDPPTRAAVTAERALLARMEGNCTVPLAGYATVQGDQLQLRGLLGKPDGSQVARGHRSGPIDAGEELGHSLAGELLERIGANVPSPSGRGLG